MLWIVCVLISSSQYGVHGQSQASGSAIDLANMNMQMMNTKCPLSPCQSVCLVRNPDTGCYVCNPSCTPGSDPNMAMGIGSLTNGQMYGCRSDTWVQCSANCDRTYDHMGCFVCECKDVDLAAVDSPSTPRTESQIIDLNQATLPRTSKAPSTTTSTSAPTTTIKRLIFQTTFSRPTKPTAHDVYTVKITSTEKASTETPNSRTTRRSTVSSTTEPKTKVQPATYDQTTKSNFIESEMDADPYKSSGVVEAKAEKNEFEANKLSFILFGLIGILSFSTIFFLYAWRKVQGKLRHNKNELYFVHKAYRQDSNAKLWNNEQLDPVYAEVTPQPPPRSLPVLSNKMPSVTSQGPCRSCSVSSETPVKEQFEENKHDYLELI